MPPKVSPSQRPSSGKSFFFRLPKRFRTKKGKHGEGSTARDHGSGQHVDRKEEDRYATSSGLRLYAFEVVPHDPAQATTMLERRAGRSLFFRTRRSNGDRNSTSRRDTAEVGKATTTASAGAGVAHGGPPAQGYTDREDAGRAGEDSESTFADFFAEQDFILSQSQDTTHARQPAAAVPAALGGGYYSHGKYILNKHSASHPSGANNSTAPSRSAPLPPISSVPNRSSAGVAAAASSSPSPSASRRSRRKQQVSFAAVPDVTPPNVPPNPSRPGGCQLPPRSTTPLLPPPTNPRWAEERFNAINRAGDWRSHSIPQPPPVGAVRIAGSRSRTSASSSTVTHSNSFPPASSASSSSRGGSSNSGDAAHGMRNNNHASEDKNSSSFPYLLSNLSSTSGPMYGESDSSVDYTLSSFLQ